MAISIEIIGDPKIVHDADGDPVHRHVDIFIGTDGNTYALAVGGLPLEGDLQAILNARVDDLWQKAEQKRHPAYFDAVDFRDLWNDLDNELQYLAAIIPTIDTMTLTDLRAAFKHSERRNERILKAMKYIMRKMR